MTDRLLRALQRGGLAIRTSDGDWTIWRGQDQRRRSIGRLGSDEIEALRLSGHLKPLGSGPDASLVWAGPQAACPSPSVAQAGAGRLMDHQTNVPQPLLLRLLKTISETSQREALIETILTYREDLEASASFGAPSGMNWRSLLAGQMIETSHHPSDRVAYGLNSASAKRRLECIREALGNDVFTLLRRMVVDGETRNKLARSYGLSNKDMELKAKRTLQSLQDVYRDKTKL